MAERLDFIGREVTSDTAAMQLALALAAQAAELGEVPVGAVLVHEQKVLGQGFNQPILAADPTAHAEVMALRDAASRLQNYRLLNTTLYVSLEPCTMCFGALIHARVQKLVYAATEPKAGVLTSALNLNEQSFYNHKLQVQGGVLAAEAGQMLSAFFAARRQARKSL